MKTARIHTKPRPGCPVCASQGRILYSGLADRLFGSSGEWDFKKCGSPDCGTLWLDPTPEEADLASLYATYYTHQKASSSDSCMRRCVNRIGSSYLEVAYAYGSENPSLISRLLSMVVYVHPMWKSTLDASVFFLPSTRNGRLLEIGCGSGAALQSMKDKGWSVVGLDFDEGAVTNATSKGLDVRLGQLSGQGFPNGSIDAVVMCHVIEHVPEPAELMRECVRVLKQGGLLVLLTPNADSWIHSRYGADWVGIDVPRHLQVFTPRSLSALAGRAGFDSIDTLTSMNGFVYQELASAELREGKVHVMGGPVSAVRRIECHIRGLWLGWLQLLFPGRGVELAAICRKYCY